MTDRERVEAIQKAFKKFLTTVRRLEETHQDKIRKILKDIDSRRLKELREKLTS